MSRRVVVCDDDKLFLRWLSRLLTEWGWTVETSLSVDLAITLLKRGLPDLIISDLRCGDHSAEELLEFLKQLPRSETVSVMIISAASEQEVTTALAAHDVTAALAKPVDIGRLRSALDHIFTPDLVSSATSIVVFDQGGVLHKATARIVEDAGAFAIFATSAEHAQTLLRNVQPEGMIVDCDSSGCELELLGSYCAANHLPLPPIIALASAINEQLVRRMLQAGVVDILLKPVSVQRLQEAIHRFAGTRSIARAAGRGEHSILVVEDFTITAKMLERMLTKDGYAVHVARSGEMAYELFRRHRPEMLLLDLNLPGMTGAELLEALLGSGQAAPSIVVTGERDHRKLRDLKRLGVMRVFHKPVIQDELLSYIGGFFSRSSPTSRNVSRYQVLLAMADEVAAEVLMSALTQKNVTSKVVTDGYQAVHELAGSPRVAVVDIVIGGLDGTEILRRAQEQRDSKTRVLAVAEEFDEEVLQELRGLGAHDAIGKPYSLPGIVEKIRALLSETSPRLSAKELGSEIVPLMRTASAMSDSEFFSIARSVGHNLAGVAALALLPEAEALGRELEQMAVEGKRRRCEELMDRIEVVLHEAGG